MPCLKVKGTWELQSSFCNKVELRIPPWEISVEKFAWGTKSAYEFINFWDIEIGLKVPLDTWKTIHNFEFNHLKRRSVGRQHVGLSNQHNEGFESASSCNLHCLKDADKKQLSRQERFRCLLTKHNLKMKKWLSKTITTTVDRESLAVAKLLGTQIPTSKITIGVHVEKHLALKSSTRSIIR